MNFRWMVVVCAAVVTAGAHGQDAVQWRVEDGGNGHWYIGVLSPDPVSWATASERAVAMGGHLATATSAGEDAFIRETVVPALGEYTGFGPILGGRFLAGGWQWVTGEPWDFTAWGASEPSSPQLEPYLHYQRPDLSWNDYDGTATGYGPPFRTFIVEWSADCNGDGVVDVGQVLSGELVDADQNGIPDFCELGPCPGDITRNGTVNGLDLAAILAAWGTDGQSKFDCDVDNSGVVDGGDLAFVLAGWGACP